MTLIFNSEVHVSNWNLMVLQSRLLHDESYPEFIILYKFISKSSISVYYAFSINLSSSKDLCICGIDSYVLQTKWPYQCNPQQPSTPHWLWQQQCIPYKQHTWAGKIYPSKLNFINARFCMHVSDYNRVILKRPSILAWLLILCMYIV